MIFFFTTQEEIENALEKVCSLLPAKYTAECDDFVKDYTPMIIHLLIQDVAPETICTLLQLCSTKDQQQHKPEVDANTECALCEFIMSEIDDLLKDNATQVRFILG